MKYFAKTPASKPRTEEREEPSDKHVLGTHQTASQFGRHYVTFSKLRNAFRKIAGAKVQNKITDLKPFRRKTIREKNPLLDPENREPQHFTPFGRNLANAAEHTKQKDIRKTFKLAYISILRALVEKNSRKTSYNFILSHIDVTKHLH